MSSVAHQHVKRKFKSPASVQHPYNADCECRTCAAFFWENHPHCGDDELMLLICGADEIGEHAPGCPCNGCLAEIEAMLPKVYTPEEWAIEMEDDEPYQSVQQQMDIREAIRVEEYCWKTPQADWFCGCPHPTCVSRREAVTQSHMACGDLAHISQQLLANQPKPHRKRSLQ